MPQLLIDFLRTNFYPTAYNLQSLGVGMFSEAYRFSVSKSTLGTSTPDDTTLVIRIGVNREAFEKDQLVYERLGASVSVPRVLGLGEYNENRFYCFSEWKPGRILTDFDKEETERLLPSLFENLLRISRVLPTPSTDFGILTGTGQCREPYRTWADFISTIDDFPSTFTPRGNEIYKPWADLYATTFLDKSLVDEAHQRLYVLLPFLPNDRHYVHGDFGYENALADGDQVTAILDWAELRCGDWLYDLAYLAYHDSLGIDYLGNFQQWAATNSLQVPNFIERIEAYFLAIFLGNIFLEANRGQRDWYEEDVTKFKRQLADRHGYPRRLSTDRY